MLDPKAMGVPRKGAETAQRRREAQKGAVGDNAPTAPFLRSYTPFKLSVIEPHRHPSRARLVRQISDPRSHSAFAVQREEGNLV